MKKYIQYILPLVAVVMMTSCAKEEIGNTATVDLSGEWMVTVDAVDDNGEVVLEDPFGLGYVQMITYNTAANTPTEMWLSDLGNFWDFTVKVKCDNSAQTFGNSAPVANTAYEDCDVTVTGGKVVYGGTKSPSGNVVDSFQCYVSFSDDDYPEAYGYTKYLIKGYRRTGLAGGEE